MKFLSLAGDAASVEAIDSAIRIFEKLGESGPHSPDGWLLSHILNHCTETGIPFTLASVPDGGYYVKRGVVEGVIPPPIQATLEQKA